VTALVAALAQVSDWPVPNAAAAVISRDGVLARVGATDHLFALASLTKPLAALGALVAIEEGALNLTDPVDEQLLPGATVEHLLSHSSGLAPDTMVRSFPPAERRLYSNIGFDLLGDLVSIATTMPFVNYFHEAVTTRLGLKSTTVGELPSRDGRSSVDDLAVVVGELLAPSRLLDPSTLLDATRVHFPSLRGVLPGYGGQDPNDWGLGFEIRGHKDPHWTGRLNSPATYGHFGRAGTMFWVDPEASLGVIALADEPFGPWAAVAWPKLSDAVLAAA
jgi:CubicO group peptidase (beta-lactamase class C family)